MELVPLISYDPIIDEDLMIEKLIQNLHENTNALCGKGLNSFCLF